MEITKKPPRTCGVERLPPLWGKRNITKENKNMTKFCEIFKTGTHTSANGVKKTWTTADLDTMVHNFHSKNSDVPLVVGHPKTNDPAFGWFKDVKRVGESLLASFKQVAPEFAQAVNSGVYKTRSISVAPDGSLRHLGWLGAKAPAIKGLQGFQFEESEAETYDFSELSDYKFEITSSIFERIRDFLIEKFSLEAAEKLISRYEIDKLKELENKTPEEVSAYCEAIEQESGKEQALPTQTGQATNTDFEAALQEKDDIITTLKNEKEQLEAKNRKEKHLQFAENSIKEGHITPSQKDSVVEFMEAAFKVDTEDGQDFAEDDENNISNKFKTFVNSIKQIDFTETDESNIDKNEIENFSEPSQKANKLKEIQKSEAEKGNNISLGEALNLLNNKKQP